jgi:hypothetical protein
MQKVLRHVAVKMRARCGEFVVELNNDGGIIAARRWRSWYRIQKTKAGTSNPATLSIAILAGLRSMLQDAVTTASTYEKRPSDKDARATPTQSTESNMVRRVKGSLLGLSRGRSQMAARREAKVTPVTT